MTPLATWKSARGEVFVVLYCNDVAQLAERTGQTYDRTESAMDADLDRAVRHVLDVLSYGDDGRQFSVYPGAQYVATRVAAFRASEVGIALAPFSLAAWADSLRADGYRVTVEGL